MTKLTFKDAMRVGTYRAARFFGTRDYTPFIILSRSRTGSNLLNASLGSHPQVHVKGEHFGHIGADSIQKRHKQVFGKQPPWIKAAGCKVFYWSLRDLCGFGRGGASAGTPDFVVGT